MSHAAEVCSHSISGYESHQSNCSLERIGVDYFAVYEYLFFEHIAVCIGFKNSWLRKKRKKLVNFFQFKQFTVYATHFLSTRKHIHLKLYAEYVCKTLSLVCYNCVIKMRMHSVFNNDKVTILYARRNGRKRMKTYSVYFSF